MKRDVKELRYLFSKLMFYLIQNLSSPLQKNIWSFISIVKFMITLKFMMSNVYFYPTTDKSKRRVIISTEILYTSSSDT